MSGRITMLGGPNLAQLGRREPRIYGTMTWRELTDLCHRWAREADLKLVFAQTDSEGELVGLVRRAGAESDGLILNAAAYPHTSVAVRDAVACLSIPVIELHLTNPAAREPLRRRNFLAGVATASICGFGPAGYRLAISGMRELLAADSRG